MDRNIQLNSEAKLKQIFKKSCKINKGISIDCKRILPIILNSTPPENERYYQFIEFLTYYSTNKIISIDCQN